VAFIRPVLLQLMRLFGCWLFMLHGHNSVSCFHCCCCLWSRSLVPWTPSSLQSRLVTLTTSIVLTTYRTLRVNPTMKLHQWVQCSSTVWFTHCLIMPSLAI